MTESVLRQIKQFKSEDGINTNQLHSNLQTEYDEDKELLDLLEGKGKKILFKINFIFRYKTK